MALVKKTTARRIDFRNRAIALLKSMEDGKIDACLGYRALYSLWCSNNAALQELRPLFRIDGIDPDGQISVTDEFRNQIREIAGKILPLFQS